MYYKNRNMRKLLPGVKLDLWFRRENPDEDWSLSGSMDPGCLMTNWYSSNVPAGAPAGGSFELAAARLALCGIFLVSDTLQKVNNVTSILYNSSKCVSNRAF